MKKLLLWANDLQVKNFYTYIIMYDGDAPSFDSLQSIFEGVDTAKEVKHAEMFRD